MKNQKWAPPNGEINPLLISCQQAREEAAKLQSGGNDCDIICLSFHVADDKMNHDDNCPSMNQKEKDRIVKTAGEMFSGEE